MTIRVLIVDDHLVVRQGLAALLGDKPDIAVVGQAANGTEALALFAQHRPDIALVDFAMPGMTGPETIAALRREHPEARCIVLTMYGGHLEVSRALQAGARGYLLKDASEADILRAIRTVHQGGRYLSEDAAARLAEHFEAGPLSDRELEVLGRLARGETNAEIAAALHMGAGTVKTHLHSILGKLGVSTRGKAIAAARRAGILPSDASPD